MAEIKEVDLMADALEELLARHGVQIAPGSRLEQGLLFARHVLHVRRGEAAIEDGDDRPKWREMHGLFDLAQRLVRAERDHPGKFQALRPWLRLFASTTGQLAQTAPTQAGDQDSDRVFELLVALCLLPRIGRIEPDKGRGQNPDLLFRYRWKTWGIACKRLYSTKPAAFRDTVTKAISQIERSSADRGLVFVSLVNVMDHDLFMPQTELGREGMSSEEMRRHLEAEKERLSAATLSFSDRDLAEVFDGAKAMPGAVHYLGTTYVTGSEWAPVQKTVQHAWSRGKVNEILHLFQAGLNSTSSEALPPRRRRGRR